MGVVEVKRKALSGMLAGMCISIGATAYLLCDSRYIGALLFCVGLITVRRYRLLLFTGMVGKALEDSDICGSLLPAYCGNLVGAALFALLVRVTRIYGAVAERAAEICEAKLSDNLLSLFVLAALCNVMINIAVDAQGKDKPYDLEAIILAVCVFVLCGFEHCIADAYYFALYAFSVSAERAIDIAAKLELIMLGNVCGGVLAHELVKRAGKR